MSHHSSSPEDERALQSAMAKLLGEFPNGKLNVQDEGALALVIGVDNGAVKMQFPKPVAWIGFTPDQAVQIAQSLIDNARKAGFKTPFSIRIGGDHD